MEPQPHQSPQAPRRRGELRRRLQRLAARTDRFCARMNDGLVAVAIVLALTLMIGEAERHPDYLLPPPDPNSALNFIPDLSKGP